MPLRRRSPVWRYDALDVAVYDRAGDREGDRLLPRVPATVSGPSAPAAAMPRVLDRRRVLVPDARRLAPWIPPRLRLARRDASEPAAPGTPGEASWRCEYE